MSDPQAPRIEFPCPDYPVKVMGDAGRDFIDFVLSATERHAPGFDRDKVSVRDSRNGRYQSVTVFITAQGEAQLQALFEDLKTNPKLKMVL
ncbi:DUF493 domain-containing protein [Exilibacterium tricleocarpae]|uniref:UPF0250 protein FKG94_23465 n=1 Tax=Exilibacterium tricleocarpae TaxID=2591008 RepID=A0A545STH5_9GAMM|nr:DUF493 domain-containing protein [Exilibacterium tricleocarpae]TQV68259.1 DUF493 domain-containing protein [Exilibacterium tricleocarpae]